MDTIEKYRIYKANKEGITLNDTHTHNKNPIFETLYMGYMQLDEGQ
jgi:hypothetical protein